MRVPVIRVLAVAVGVTFCSFGSAEPVSAQTTAGVKLGLNMSSIRFEGRTGPSTTEVIDDERRNGVVAGVFIGRQIGGALGLQLEGLVSQKGATFEDGDVEFHTTYLEFPVMATYGIGPADGPRVRLMAGPAFAVRLSDKQVFREEELRGDAKFEFKNSDIGLAIGGALEVERFTFDVRYTHGLVNLIDDERFDDDESFKNRVLTFSVGWRFR